jgi:hypothetical protein
MLQKKEAWKVEKKKKGNYGILGVLLLLPPQAMAE